MNTDENYAIQLNPRQQFMWDNGGDYFEYKAFICETDAKLILMSFNDVYNKGEYLIQEFTIEEIKGAHPDAFYKFDFIFPGWLERLEIAQRNKNIQNILS